MALCNDASCLELPDVDGVLLFEEPVLVALPRRHRLAGRSRLRLMELAEERWMLGTDRACPDAGRFIRACHAEGFDPKIAFHNDDYTAVLGFVAAGMGVAPVPDMVARNASSDVRICALHGVGARARSSPSCPADTNPGRREPWWRSSGSASSGRRPVAP